MKFECTRPTYKRSIVVTAMIYILITANSQGWRPLAATGQVALY